MGAQGRSVKTLQKVAIPIFIDARPKFSSEQVRFYETLAVPQELLRDEAVRAELASWNKWRLDFPRGVGNLKGRDRTVLLVAEKILTRGCRTILSPTLEAELRKRFKATKAGLSSFDCRKYLALANPETVSGMVYDGFGTEQDFYENILPSILGPHYRRNVLYQVLLDSLTSSGTDHSGRRVDFLVNTGGVRLVVELDSTDSGQFGHGDHEARDASRDKLLNDLGFQVFRISNQDAVDQKSQRYQELEAILRPTAEDEVSPDDFSAADRFMLACKLAHQIQIAVVEAALAGLIDLQRENTIYVDGDSTGFATADVDLVAKAALTDLDGLLENLSKLYGADFNACRNSAKVGIPNGERVNCIVITYSDNVNVGIPRFVIQDVCYPGSVANQGRMVRPDEITEAENTSEEVLEYFLRYVFRFEKFNEGQHESITRALKRKDAVVLLPTGAGKSVAFQLSALLMPGVAVVIDPIIALINDQIENLSRAGIDRAVGITGEIADPEVRGNIMRAAGRGAYLFCYVAPERFQSEDFRNHLKALTTSIPVPLVAIDEAHCVSEWGHDFRTAYLNIGRVAREYCTFSGRTPPIMALTGTASNAVLRDVQRELQIEDFEAVITPRTFDRKELHYAVITSSSEEKFDRLRGALQTLLPGHFGINPSAFFTPQGEETYSGIVFCPHVGGTFGVVDVAQRITNETGVAAEFYGGSKVPKGWVRDSWTAHKHEVAKKFKLNEAPLLVATKAFGMGVDKPNIRYTIHYGIPCSVESFYQEAGRAGRDRKDAMCVILLSNDDQRRTSKLLDPSTTIEEMAAIQKKEVNWENGDDVTRGMWFHTNSFRGIREEMAGMGYV